MKTKILFFSLFLTVVFANAQVPKNFNFQAVARNAQGQLIVSQSVSVKATLTANYNGGSYSEKHTLTTNQYGLFSLVVGKGTVLSGNINTMAWGKGVKLTVEFDPLGGTNYQLVSTTDLASVPYAIMADSAMKVANMPKKLCDLQLSACNQVISDVSSPVSSTDAVNKAYADAILARVKYLESVLSITYNSGNTNTCNYGTVSDYDGNQYKTLTIGTKTWMVENLRVMHYSSGVSIPTTGCFAYSFNETLTPTYGRLYTWATAMNGQTTESSQGVCPTGWHIPTDLEFTTMLDFYGGATVAGGKTKEFGLSHWSSPNTGVTETNCINVLPSGFWDPNSSPDKFNNKGIAGYFWSSTQNSASYAWSRNFYYNNVAVLQGNSHKNSAISIRCVKD